MENYKFIISENTIYKVMDSNDDRYYISSSGFSLLKSKCTDLTLKEVATRNHMEITTREGREYIFVGASFYNKNSDGWLRSTYYNDDLTNKENTKYDIIEMKLNGAVIWERKEEKIQMEYAECLKEFFKNPYNTYILIVFKDGRNYKYEYVEELGLLYNGMGFFKEDFDKDTKWYLCKK